MGVLNDKRCNEKVSVNEIKRNFKDDAEDEDLPTKTKLWITNKEFNDSVLEDLGVNPERYKQGDKLHIHIANGERKKRQQKHEKTKKYIKSMVEKKRQERYDDPDAFINIKRKPRLTQSMLLKFHEKKGGSTRKNQKKQRK